MVVAERLSMDPTHHDGEGRNSTIQHLQGRRRRGAHHTWLRGKEAGQGYGEGKERQQIREEVCMNLREVLAVTKQQVVSCKLVSSSTLMRKCIMSTFVTNSRQSPEDKTQISART